MNDVEVNQLMAEVWSAVLGLEIGPAAIPTGDGDERTVTGFVHLSGDWHGTVSLACPTGLARVAAATMFGTEAEAITTDDVRDAHGELTNIAGGGIKRLIAGSCDLSLPTVVEGLDYTVSVPGTEERRSFGYVSLGHPVVVRLLEKATAAV
jgi:chemotaxis protein CheX